MARATRRAGSGLVVSPDQKLNPSDYHESSSAGVESASICVATTRATLARRCQVGEAAQASASEVTNHAGCPGAVDRTDTMQLRQSR